VDTKNKQSKKEKEVDGKQKPPTAKKGTGKGAYYYGFLNSLRNYEIRI
jgi:hypothetical protein